MKTAIGEVSQQVIDLLGLAITPGTEIYFGETNREHMQRNHPEDYKQYGHRLKEILEQPDYVSLHPGNGSIQYIKELDDRVMVAVRISENGLLFARTLFVMSESKWNSYTRKGYIKKVHPPRPSSTFISAMESCTSEVRTV